MHQNIYGSSEPPLLVEPSLSFSSQASLSNPAYGSRTGLSARHWHNRYMAWQARERRQREEQANLEAEKRRIFGTPDNGHSTFSGEDDELCTKMLEYFGGLDFIDS